MRRLHLIELHEQRWYPESWRKLFQRGLGRSHSLANSFKNFIVPFSLFLERLEPKSILDLCSGSGDAACMTWKEIVTKLECRPPTLVLSDLYPNIDSFRVLKREHPGMVDFFPESVNALRPPKEAPRVRTMFNCLHHFKPDQVKSILRNASDNAEGIAVIEVTGRTWKNMLQTLVVLPFAASILLVFFLRPFRLENILWGLLVPVIPLTAVFDGIVSNLRTYTVDELRELTDAVGKSDYEWEIGIARIESAGLDATYLLGWRKP